MKNKKGFTLIELLATITLLSIIIGLVVYVALNSIKKSKEKTYSITIKNIEKNASNYLIENGTRLFFLTKDENTEYQCVTVENLVDYGYISNNSIDKSKIADDKLLSKNDYIYIERNINTKAITKTKYIEDENEEYINICNGAVKASADIIINSNPSLNEWSKEKNITITYRLKNLNDVNTISEYIYRYNYTGNSDINNVNEQFDKMNISEVMRVTSNGIITATINTSPETIKIQEVNKIDNTGPNVNLSKEETKIVKKNVTILLKVTDIGSGINKSSFTNEDLNVLIGGNKPTSSILTLDSCENSNTCIYKLQINDLLHAGEITIGIDKNKIFDEINNGNDNISINTGIKFDNTYIVTFNANGGSVNPTSKIVTYNTIYGDMPIPTRNGYSFIGWYTQQSGGTKIEPATNVTITENQTLYARWNDITKPVCTIEKSNVGSETGVNLTITCTDNSGSCTLSKTSESNIKNGTYTYTVTDPSGNTNTCSTTISSYNCNSYQYACGQYACGEYNCGSYACGTNTYACGKYVCGSYACGGKYCCGRKTVVCTAPGHCFDQCSAYCDKMCDTYCTNYCTEAIYCTRMCTSYCTSYCTGYKTCYK